MRALSRVLVGVGCATSLSHALGATWSHSENVSATETYTSNANYAPTEFARGDWVTSVAGSASFSGVGARLRVGGSVGASAILYASQNQSNSIAPTANVVASLEAIEKFAYVDAQASVTQTFASPFGPQPPSLVNATSNRYTQQTYSLSPYVKGVLGTTEISYLVRNDNYWTIASSFGASSPNVPSTYSNVSTLSASAPAKPVGWTLSYIRTYYDNGLGGGEQTGNGTYSQGSALAYYPYSIDPQLQVSARAGYESNEFPNFDQHGAVYGVGVQWRPTDRTHVGGFWDHRFFGSSYDWTVTHRLPNAALSGAFVRGINSYPQAALAIPAGASVAQFVDAAFQTRIPDPIARQQAVDQFLARSGLPPTLITPVSYYASTLTLQTSGTLSGVLIGVFNSLSLTLFYVRSQQITATGAELPPIFAASQDNTQRGVGLGYSHRLTPTTSLGAGLTYSTSMVNVETGQFAGLKSNNASATLSIGTSLGAKTSASAGVSYSWSDVPSSTAAGTTATLNVFATVSHTF